MDTQKRLKELQQSRAQHLQVLQQTQMIVFKLDGAIELMNEIIAAEAQQPSQVNIDPVERNHDETKRSVPNSASVSGS